MTNSERCFRQKYQCSAIILFALPTAALANFFARAFSAILVIDQPTNGMVASNPGA